MWMVEDENDYAAKLDSIHDWGRDHPWFDISFVASLRDRLKTGATLTEKMKDAVDNVYSKTVIRSHIYHNRSKYPR